MRYEFKKIDNVHEDDRRKLTAVFNGDFTAKQVKIIEAKDSKILGNHWHWYAELFYCVKGKAEYWLESVDTQQKAKVTLLPGYRLIIHDHIAHAAIFDLGTMTIEATASEYVAGQCDVPYEVKR